MFVQRKAKGKQERMSDKRSPFARHKRKAKKEGTAIETKKMSVAIIYGVTTIFILAIIASLIFSILLRFTALTESSLSLVMMIVTFLSLFIGGFISGGKGKKQGILIRWRNRQYFT